MLSLSKLATSIALFWRADASGTGAFFQSKTVIIPHDDKLHRGGEDSADSSDQVLAVADGVGGWANKGINPGLFSAKLTRSLIDRSIEDPSLDARQLLIEGCNIAGKEFQGSATIVTLKLAEDMTIKAANLGDSGYALFHVRPNDTLEMYFRSPTQQKTHNFPF